MNTNKKPKINVMITGMGSTTALSVIKGLRLSKIYEYKITGTDIYNKSEIAGATFCDKIYKVPLATNNFYISELIKICKKENVNLLIPIIDQEVEKIAKHMTLFRQNNIIVCSSSYETVKNCNDKYKTYLFLKNKGIETNEVYLQKNLKKIANSNGPFFIKPRRGCSSINCYSADNLKELKIILKKIKNPIIQRLLSGKQYVIDIINDLNGKNLIAIPRYEISSKAGIGVKAKTVKNEKLILYGKKISETLQIKGTANIEVFACRNRISLIEVNPRFSAGSILSIAAGVNIPDIVIDLFLNKHITKKRLLWKKNIYMTRYWQEIFFYNRKNPIKIIL